ncbi:transcription termination factor, mitochondrial isoform X1 [Neodiprion lecontei]|uniref:Transcription termination factor, mitochondrial isoform X1 n=1 Tax=Neodiprion lecontei TaxID=441921 RepID=A0ABM3FJ15_NEOLC|nr:transcription termination factor, mitochondrial isoform X1 [Neodiprion lecontei]XP_046588006.1 transcription termination factor, mitochondrial isoform X1 [Neodiprion lecontei]
MMEVILFLARGQYWPEKYGRLMQECRQYWILQVIPYYQIIGRSPKLSCILPTTTQLIPQQLSWWNSFRRPRLRYHDLVAVNIPLTVEAKSHHKIVNTSCEVENTTLALNDSDTHIFDFKCRTANEIRASSCLQKLLCIDIEKADIWVKANRSFSLINPADISLNYKACLDADISEATIRENAWLLSYPHNIFKTKMKLIKNMFFTNFQNGIPLFRLGIFRLLALSKQLIYDVRWYGGSNRIQYLAEQLQCSMFEVCQLIVKYQFMQNHPFDKLRDTLKILLHYRIEREAIMNDCWAFRQNPETIIDRLERIREAGIFPVKPWMVRCIEPVIARRINKESHRRAILGENGTIIYYLSERFQCDENKVAVILSKLPQIKHVSGPKTKKVVDFLIENEYTIEHVIRVPRILFHGVEKAQKRLNELLEYGHKPKSLIVFCKTEKEYNEYLERIKKKWLKNEKK